ncbi:hypothetical protein L210DRAFT_960294 [Boletus edulis BED1]|uniref:Uncharacterized protein n=1 Tax=Boletus edulis BED1 TaxID=1328754 RepID=A0AAD4BDS0_BOLED|nr:hypothetical protein L210DRAFT_960294 [Boletus edulis BED1]
MQIFRFLHRRTKSEGDVSTLQFQQCVTGLIAPVFVPLQVSLPSFDPTRELYDVPTNPVQGPMAPSSMDKLDARIIELEAQVAHLQTERSTLEQDLVDYRADLLHTRTELYSEMLRSARHQQQAMDDFRTIQKLEARHQRFCTLLVDIGVHRSTVDEICEVLQSGNGSPDNILVDAIKHATNDDNTLLARLKPIVTAERTPEHYQSALNLTLSIRKELKSQKKRSKFWKKLAQEDDRHASIITPSPSDISSIRQDLSPERQSALESLVARRRAARHSENAENDVFGGRRRESVLDTLASSLASRPRRSIQDDLRLSSSFSSSSASSASTTYFSYISGLSRIPRGATIETPTMPSHIPPTLSTSLRRSSRGSSQSIVLGNISLNVSRSSSINHTLPEEAEQHTNPDTGPVPTVTHSQDLLQNVRRASQENGHRRMPSTSSRRSGPTHSARSSFRLSAVSPVRACRPTGALTAPDLDISGHTAVDTPSFHTPDVMMRLSDPATNTNPDLDTPASSEVTRSADTPFNDTRALPKYYGVDTPFSPSDLEPQVASTPLDGSVPCKPLDGNAYSRDTRFLEHLDCSMSMTMSTSTSVSTSESSANAQDGHEGEHEDDHVHADTGIPLGESNDSLFTTSASASASSSLTANETPAPTTPPTPSPSPVPSPSLSTPPSGKASIKRSMLPVLAKHLRGLSLSGTSPDRGRLIDKLRGLRSLSRSRSGSGSGSGSGSPFESVWRGSPARSDSSRSSHLTPSPSPVKGSGIPMLQRRMTIRARSTSVRKV